MKGAHSISTRRAYGVQRVCRVWQCARSSVYARRQATTSPTPCRRRGPVGAAPDDVLVGHIRRVLEASPFHGEGYRKAWAKLRVEGIRTAPERVRRLMREHDLQAPHRVGQAHGPKAHDGTITTAAPDVMWGTDMTATVTVGEGTAYVFVAVDHCTTECVGLHAAKRGTRFEALEPIRQGVRERFGTIGEGVARGLRLRHDHGSNYLADDFQQEVAFFGIESSPSFVREPEGNGVAERFIRTLKENLLWVRSFDTIETLRLRGVLVHSGRLRSLSFPPAPTAVSLSCIGGRTSGPQTSTWRADPSLARHPRGTALDLRSPSYCASDSGCSCTTAQKCVIMGTSTLAVVRNQEGGTCALSTVRRFSRDTGSRLVHVADGRSGHSGRFVDTPSDQRRQTRPARGVAE